MSTEKDSRDLLDELETLQRVLDDAAGEQIDLARALTQLNTVDEIPVLSDLLQREEPPILKAVQSLKLASSKVAQLNNLRNSHPIPPTQPKVIRTPEEMLEALHQEIVRQATQRALSGHGPDEEPNTLELAEALLRQSFGEPHLQAVPTIVTANPAPAASQPPVEVPIVNIKPEEPAVAPSPRETVRPLFAATSTAAVAPSAVAQSAAAPSAAAPSAVAPSAVAPSAAAPSAVAPSAVTTSTTAPRSPSAPATEAPAPPRVSSNPFLPQDVIDRLTRERLAAQHSAEEAHRTMQRVMEKQSRKDNEAVSALNTEEKNQLINTLVDELTPLIQIRLREKLRTMLIKKPE